MADVNTIVTINIVIQDASVSQANFGIPMVMTHEAAFGPELVRSYSTTDGSRRRPGSRACGRIKTLPRSLTPTSP